MLRTTMAVLITGLMVVSLWHAGCTVQTAPRDDETITVVTTIFPVADLVANVGGSKVAISHLLPSGASPHTFEPTVKQIKKFSEADVFIYVGGGLDDWAIKLMDSASDDLIVVELTSAVHLLDTTHGQIVGEDHHKVHNHYDEHDDCNYGPQDPHIWLDPLIIRDDVLPLITEVLAQIAPDKKEFFYKQQADYANQLTVLHEEIKERTSKLTQNKFISFHSAWQYFAARYNLEEAAVIARFPGQEPSAYWLANLVHLARDIGTKVIFCEPQLNPAVATQIANEIGGEVIFMDPLGGEDLEGRDSYIDIMLYNTTALEKALK